MDRAQVIKYSYQIPGQMWPVELGWLYDTFSKSTHHLEIGVYCGRSTYVTAYGMSKGVIYAVDACLSDIQTPEWIASVRSATFEACKPSKCIINFMPNYSVDAARLIPQNTRFDSIFIDGDHNYAECRADIECWLPFLRPGGIISGHDFWSRDAGVMEAVHQTLPSFKVAKNTRIWYDIPA